MQASVFITATRSAALLLVLSLGVPLRCAALARVTRVILRAVAFLVYIFVVHCAFFSMYYNLE